jgi:GTP-binding protein
MSVCYIALVLIDAEEGITEQDAKIAGLSYEQYTKRVDTSPLNDLVERSVRKNPMARFQNRSMSISYATHTGIKPPTFIFFVPHAKGVHFSYERYLMNAIRSEFGFDKVPIKLIFRKKR